jgi:hypothetical protein
VNHATETPNVLVDQSGGTGIVTAMNRILLNRQSCTLLACLPLLLTACSRENESTVVPATDASQPAVDPDTQAASPAVRPPDAQPPTAVAVPMNDPVAALSALTQAVRKFAFEKRQVPANLEELATAGYVQRLPQPPAGKKFVIDKKRMVVELTNQ